MARVAAAAAQAEAEHEAREAAVRAEGNYLTVEPPLSEALPGETSHRSIFLHDHQVTTRWSQPNGAASLRVTHALNRPRETR